MKILKEMTNEGIPVVNLLVDDEEFPKISIEDLRKSKQWQQMKIEFRDFAQYFNIGWLREMQKKLSLDCPKIPFLAAYITEVFQNNFDRYLRLQDESQNQIEAVLASNIKLHDDLIVGSVLVIENFALISCKDRGILLVNICQRNIITIYSNAERFEDRNSTRVDQNCSGCFGSNAKILYDQISAIGDKNDDFLVDNDTFSDDLDVLLDNYLSKMQ